MVTPDSFHHELNVAQDFSDFGSVDDEPFGATLLQSEELLGLQLVLAHSLFLQELVHSILKVLGKPGLDLGKDSVRLVVVSLADFAEPLVNAGAPGVADLMQQDAGDLPALQQLDIAGSSERINVARAFSKNSGPITDELPEPRHKLLVPVLPDGLKDELARIMFDPEDIAVATVANGGRLFVLGKVLVFVYDEDIC